MVLVDSHKISRVSWYSGCPEESISFRVPDYHRLWYDFPDNSTMKSICNSYTGPHNPAATSDRGLGCSRFARRYSGNHSCFLFLGLLRCFSSPRSLCSAYIFSRKWHGITRTGLPHSEISGSKVACTSPKLIAACHVLHRLFVPRHPPCALGSLTEIKPSAVTADFAAIHQVYMHHRIQLSKITVWWR